MNLQGGPLIALEGLTVRVAGAGPGLENAVSSRARPDRGAHERSLTWTLEHPSVFLVVGTRQLKLTRDVRRALSLFDI